MTAKRKKDAGFGDKKGLFFGGLLTKTSYP
jgi:hypothetical protein